MGGGVGRERGKMQEEKVACVKRETSKKNRDREASRERERGKETGEERGGV